ncbi:HAD family hydrolase [Streptomyces sp. NPDC045470]|uniref:HAD family hydrolase n=1 Tax=Streptomyces sp. NPDC045470 TaxID=3155469 RepID=UPI0033C37305
MIEAVVFDIGGTLVSDERYWGDRADRLNVPRHMLSGLVGAVVAQGRDSADAIRLLRPGVDVGAEYRARGAAGRGQRLDESELYPDARPALRALRAAGIRVLIAGNRTVRAGELMRDLGLPADAVTTSGDWGVAKPHPDFFRRVVAFAGATPERIVYVGDNPANDIAPALAAGLRTVHVRRGVHGYLWADSQETERADWRIDSLAELPALLAP